MLLNIIIIFNIMTLCFTESLNILGFGMPVVDYVVKSSDTPELSKEVKANLNYQMENSTKSNEILSKLYHSSKVHRTAGGSTLNAVRMSNFLLKSKVAYIGCVGKDLNGEFIKKVLKEEKINFGFVESEANATSTAIVLIDDNDRDLYVNVGASSDLSLEKIKEFDSLFNNAKIIMTDAYLSHYRYAEYEYIFRKYSANDNTILGFSLAAWEVLRDYYTQIEKLLKFCDLLFMNESEFDTLMKLSNYFINEQSTMEGFVALLEEKKSNKNKDLVLVITRGKLDVLIAVHDYKKKATIVSSVPIIKIDPMLEIDKTGLGDAFAGGFLAGMIMQKNYIECATLGNIMSSKVIQLNGFQIPKVTNESIEEELRMSIPNSNYMKNEL